MTTDTLFAVFEDFNEPGEESDPAPVEDVPPAFDPIGEVREEAWTGGYLTGRQERDTQTADQPLLARLLTSVHELDSTAARAVDAASLVVARLLVDTVIAVTSDDWSARLLDRVRAVADRIKPALTVAPEFVLRDAHGGTQCFGDISALTRALETGDAGEDVTIRWHRGEAAISRTALLEDLRDAFVPLSAGLANEQTRGIRHE
jgi:hypothetical protein